MNNGSGSELKLGFNIFLSCILFKEKGVSRPSCSKGWENREAASGNGGASGREKAGCASSSSSYRGRVVLAEEILGVAAERHPPLRRLPQGAPIVLSPGKCEGD